MNCDVVGEAGSAMLDGELPEDAMGPAESADDHRFGQAILRRVLCVAVLAVVVAAGAFDSIARADGDPASDVLVSQTLFVPADVSVSAQQQTQLRGLLRAAGRAGFPMRVAVIPSGYDLGSVTALWRKPRTYARFLGIELSIVHRQPLLVVMPNGFGFSWPGHSTASAYRLLARLPIGPGGVGLLTAARAAVGALAAANGSTIAPVSRPATNPGSHPSSSDAIAIILAALAALTTTLAVRLILRRRRRARPAAESEPAIRGRREFPVPRRWAVPGVAVLCCVATGTPILVLSLVRHAPTSPTTPATQLSAVATPYTWRAGQRRAPTFRLKDQNGRPVSLAAYRGRPVIVTFVDPLCRNFCPLAAHVLNQVDRDLPAAQRPVIIAVSVDIYADTRADLTEDYRRWDLVPQWRWAVGEPRQLASVWRRYHIGVSVKTKTIAGTTVHFITHDEVAFVVDRAGYVRALYGWPYDPRNVEAAVKRMASSSSRS
jgi:cytochrome oxidase Cu insertion factor (SCO1/SenC/PrrC family)